MAEKEKSRLNARVFRRSNKTLILLWNRVDGADPTKTEIVFTQVKEGAKPVKLEPSQFSLNDPVSLSRRDDPPDVQVSANTVICLIQEIEAGLDPSAAYYVKIKYGDESASIRLTPQGVFPSHEKEARDKNVHLMAWDDESQMWRKVSGVRGARGEFFLGVSMSPSSVKKLAAELSGQGDDE